MSGQPDGRTPRSSTSSPASAHPGSTRSKSTSAEEELVVAADSSKRLNDHRERSSNTWDEPYQTKEGLGYRTERARRSGGFLLNDAIPLNWHDATRRPLQEATRDVAGRFKADEEVLIVPKRSPARHRNRHRPKTSVGSSPLSTVVYNDNTGAGSSNNTSNEPDQILNAPPQNASRDHDTSNNVRTNGHTTRVKDLRHQEASGIIGYDTDPAQIVNLALNLSESRRRNINGGRLSPVYPVVNRRYVSIGQGNLESRSNHVVARGASLQQHSKESRRMSRNSLPSSTSYLPHEARSPKSEQSSQGSRLSAISGDYELAVSDALVFNPSEATLSRAEKARFALELSFEYRRLLQYLPPLPSSDSISPSIVKPSKKVQGGTLDGLGRTFNPLQYIRNRNIRGRGRDRKYLDAEAEGWKDLDRVKLWVNTIADMREAGVSRSDDNFPLPPFSAIQLDIATDEAAPLSEVEQSSPARVTRSEKQNKDWITTPWDMLADISWLDRDDNVKKIEGPGFKKLWQQQQATKELTPRTSFEQDRSKGKRSLSLTRQTAPEKLRSLVSSTRNSTSMERGHSRGNSYEPRSPVKDMDSPRDRRGRWRRSFIRARSQSDSGESGTDNIEGYARGRRRGQDDLDTAALEKHMMEMLAKEMNGDVFTTPSYLEKSTEDEKAAMVEVDEQRKLPVSDIQLDEPMEALKKGNGIFSSPKARRERASLEESRGRQPRTSSEGLVDSPNTPNKYRLGPSIFINRSAPGSRSVSPKKPAAPSRLASFRRNRSNSRRAVSETDFAVDSKPLEKSSPDTAKSSKAKDTFQGLEKSESSSNLLSPITAELFGKRFRRANHSSASVKSGKESDSKFRGFMKGGRIAELVGNEVSKVGDMIWRREGSNLSSVSSPASVNESGDSDTDGEMSTTGASPETDLSRATTNDGDGTALSRLSTRNGQPMYHTPNLPTFRSSISNTSPDSKAATPDNNHITRQQLAHAARTRSPRFARLAPPRIDVSPSSSPPMTRTQTRSTYDHSRDSSTSRSDSRLRGANARLNDILGIPGTIQNRIAPTGLSNLEPSHHQRPSIGKREWSISDRSVSHTRGGGAVTKRDIARVRALLLSSGIKAHEIARQADTISDPPFLPQLREIQQRTIKPVPRVPKAQEHLLTAKLVVAEIDAVNQSLRDRAEAFSSEEVEGLHRALKELDGNVGGQLVPRVRAAADDADELSMQLTTTHTLAVKRLNDSVDSILRRRRRRLRWVRRGGYMLLEWLLLGIMWAVWLVVVAVRLVRGTIRGFLGAVKWFFWM